MKNAVTTPALKKSICALLTAALLLSAVPASGQDSQWRNVSSLKAGDQVVVKTSDAGLRHAAAKVVSADENGLTLDLGKKGSKTISRADIQEVRLFGARTRAYQTAGALMLLGGSATELGITLRNVHSLKSGDGSQAYSSIPLLAVAGGLAVALAKGRPHLIYKK